MILIACTADKTKLWLSLSAKQQQNPCSGHPCTCIPGFEFDYDWPAKYMPLSICQSKMKGNSKHFSLSLLGASQKKDICAVCRRYLPRLNYVSNLCDKILLCNCNKIIKKAMALVGKTSTLHMPHFFVPFFAIYYHFCMTITMTCPLYERTQIHF